jgi:hypothetical protein
MITLVSAVFTAVALYYYGQAEYARANYWLITTLIVETVYLRVSSR